MCAMVAEQRVVSPRLKVVWGRTGGCAEIRVMGSGEEEERRPLEVGMVC